MVENKSPQTICSVISKYPFVENVRFCLDNYFVKYIFNIDCCFFEITYYFTDKYYRIKMEKQRNNSLEEVVLLTKSKLFYKSIAKLLREKNLLYKSFNNHVECLMDFLEQNIAIDNLNCLEKAYLPDLKFDGIFI